MSSFRMPCVIKWCCHTSSVKCLREHSGAGQAWHAWHVHGMCRQCRCNIIGWAAQLLHYMDSDWQQLSWLWHKLHDLCCFEWGCELGYLISYLHELRALSFFSVLDFLHCYFAVHTSVVPRAHCTPRPSSIWWTYHALCYHSLWCRP